MAEVKWIKISTAMFEDEKIRLIESLPEGETIINIWLRMLILAGKTNDDGYIYLSEGVPYTAQMLAVVMNKPQPVMELAIQTFTSFKMISEDEKGIRILNWEKHQNIDGLDRIREQTKERVRRHREQKKQKQLPTPKDQEGCNVTCNVTATDGNATDIEVEREREVDIDKDNNTSPTDATEMERTILKVLYNVNAYKFDAKKDLTLIRQLAIDFPTLDIHQEVRKWATYKLDKPLTSKSNPRSQLRNWCQKSSEWQRNKKGGTRNGAHRNFHGRDQEAGKADTSRDPGAESWWKPKGKPVWKV